MADRFAEGTLGPAQGPGQAGRSTDDDMDVAEGNMTSDGRIRNGPVSPSSDPTPPADVSGELRTGSDSSSHRRPQLGLATVF